MQSQSLFTKTHKVIRSCKTIEQARVARKFFNLARKQLTYMQCVALMSELDNKY